MRIRAQGGYGHSEDTGTVKTPGQGGYGNRDDKGTVRIREQGGYGLSKVAVTCRNDRGTGRMRHSEDTGIRCIRAHLGRIRAESVYGSHNPLPNSQASSYTVV